ncbi:hypothetical protein [Clostridium sp.]|jgi:hypothetical protein|uniref:hypothetical protein n=1 Tax=Clostridium sp. TaxID=1506 RepID=UPI003EE91EAD
MYFGRYKRRDAKKYAPITGDSYMGENLHEGTGYRFEYLTCDSTCIITNYEKLL